MAHRPKHVVEYVCLRAAVVLLCLLPYRAALGVGWLLARLSGGLLRSKVREARRRIRLVFGEDLAPEAVSRIAWISWRNMVFNLVEGMRLSRFTREWILSHHDSGSAFAGLLESLREDGGGIIAVPHMGNWELAGLACQLRGAPVIAIVGKQRNPLVNAWMQRTRESFGMLTLERGSDLMRPIVREIRAGRCLAMVPDSRMPYADIEVPFLGGTANLGSGTARFARMTGSTIVPVLPLRVGWGRHRTELLEPVPPVRTDDKKRDLRTMTEAVVRQLEAGIRRYPEQWFWYNSRWVLDPVEGKGLREES